MNKGSIKKKVQMFLEKIIKILLKLFLIMSSVERIKKKEKNLE